MTGMPSLTATPADSSLAFVLDYLSKNGVDDAAVWSVLDKVDRAKLAQLLADLDALDATKYDKAVNVGISSKTFETIKSGKKGKLFEEIAATILSGVTCFGARKDIPTATNQLDVLVSMGPTSAIVPAFRAWGTHFICECKFHDKGVSVEWIQKLESLLGTHGSRVGLLISKKPISKGTRGNIPHMLQLFAMKGVFILCLSREDLDKCAAGDGIIQMLVDRQIAIQMGIAFMIKPSV